MEEKDKLCPVLTDDISLTENDKYILIPGSIIYNLGQQRHLCAFKSILEEVYIWLIDIDDQWICERLYQCNKCGKIFLPVHFSLSHKSWISRYSIINVQSYFLRARDISAQYKPVSRKVRKTEEYLDKETKIWYSDNHEGVFHYNRKVMEKHYVRLGNPVLEPGEIDHFESTRNDQSRLIRNSQCTSMTN